jgi:hypothetical protein
MKRTMLLTVVGLIAASASLVFSQESRIKRANLPAAAEATIARESAGATIKGFSKEKENGIQTYEAEMVVDGLTRDISVDSNGNILEIEQEVRMASLPETVQNALKAAAGKGTIGKIESLNKGGKLVAYEAQVKGGKRREVQVGPNGEKLARPE